MSTLKLNSFFVDLKLSFRVDLKNVDLNNYTQFAYYLLHFHSKHNFSNDFNIFPAKKVLFTISWSWYYYFSLFPKSCVFLQNTFTSLILFLWKSIFAEIVFASLLFNLIFTKNSFKRDQAATPLLITREKERKRERES